MKKPNLIIAAVLLLVIGSCGSNLKKDEVSEGKSPVPQKETAVKETKAASEDAHATIMLTKADFLDKVMNYEKNQTDWVFEGDKPCLIDFYADWCAPCRTTSPILEELAVEYAGKIDIYKIDTEAERELAGIFGIQSIPSFLFVPMEGKPTMSSGIARTPEETKEMFRQQINEILLKKS
mgnify:CR=1 FL=1